MRATDAPPAVLEQRGLRRARFTHEPLQLAPSRGAGKSLFLAFREQLVDLAKQRADRKAQECSRG
jgi:hypothetical protein